MRIAESVLLTCWPPAPEARIGVDAQVGRIDLDLADSLGLRAGSATVQARGVDAALRLGLRHALHAVRAGLELELAVRAAALDARDDFLVAAVLAGAAELSISTLPAAARSA